MTHGFRRDRDDDDDDDDGVDDADVWLDRQRRRWEAGDHVDVEALLGDRIESLGVEALLDLINAEAILRDRHGMPIDAAAMTARFPRLAGEIRAMLEVHEAIGSDSAAETGNGRESDVAPIPSRIGRYRVVRRIGSGTFGTVYLGHDDHLDRPVAIKMARDGTSADGTGNLVDEARRVAGLSHPGIATVHDVGLDQGRRYLVTAYAPGGTLADRIGRGPLPFREAALLAADVADALQQAHLNGIVHRDVKPSNVVFGRDGRPLLIDFGLAVHDDELPGERGRVAGTPAYLAPEQVRGEGHRIDGRADVYSLGAVLYEMMTGQPPFRGDSAAELIDQILHREPRPPRSICDAIPQPLELVCLRAMAKRISDRPTTARDLADDLRRAIEPVPTADRSVAPDPSVGADAPHQVVPKGLRPFGAEDADFFLELLPGPRDRQGLPESIRFWKSRIEAADRDLTVGLIYGPSGSGKSSLVRAGLLPRLDPAIISIVIEAARVETESRMESALRRRFPALADQPAGDLAGLVATIRRDRSILGDRRLLIVIDQLEQWLLDQIGDGSSSTESMASALRQADGDRVAFLLLVRDDFWAAVAGLFRRIDTLMAEDRNVRLVDRFPSDHARRVLELFGRAYGRIVTDPPAADTLEFLNHVAGAIAEGGRVAGVRLSLLTEMFRDRPWTLASLRAMGGLDGLGVRFLDESFGPGAVPERRALAPKARRLLQALLTDETESIRGRRREIGFLADACGLERSNSTFTRLLQILDRELRIITPVDPDGRATTAQGPTYQITHDAMVRPLRDWLGQERRRTWRGRAALKLEERSDDWSRRRDPRFLPTILEHAAIRLAVPAALWTPNQRSMLDDAARTHAIRIVQALIVPVVLLLASIPIVRRTRVEAANQAVRALAIATPGGVPAAIEGLRAVRTDALPGLERLMSDGQASPLARIHAAMALAALVAEPSEMVFGRLVDGLGQADPSPDGCRNFVAAFRRFGPTIHATIRRGFHESDDPQDAARRAIVLLYLGDPGPVRETLAFADDPGRRTALIHEFPRWNAGTGPVLSLIRGGADTVEDEATRSGAITAVGLLRDGDLSAADRSEIVNLFSTLYRDSPERSTHSVATWALKRWGAGLPEVTAGPVPDDSGRSWYVNREGMTMMAIPVDPQGSTFFMGDDDPDTLYDRTVRRVTLVRPFWIDRAEVTVAAFERFRGDRSLSADERPGPFLDRPPEFGDRDYNPKVSPTDDCPINLVTWEEAVLFCNWLSRREGLNPCYDRVGPRRMVDGYEFNMWDCDFDRDGYRLPTEAEWEYACRAGATTVYPFGDDPSLIPDYVNESFRGFKRARPAGSLLPNAWGLFDTVGNVWEWCWDVMSFPDATPVIDPQGPPPPAGLPESTLHVYKGGGVNNSDGGSRCSSRGGVPINGGTNNLGFRVVRTIPIRTVERKDRPVRRRD